MGYLRCNCKSLRVPNECEGQKKYMTKEVKDDFKSIIAAFGKLFNRLFCMSI